MSKMYDSFRDCLYRGSKQNSKWPANLRTEQPVKGREKWRKLFCWLSHLIGRKDWDFAVIGWSKFRGFQQQISELGNLKP